MTILITGNADLLGSRLADWLTENSDHIIIGIDDLSGGYIENVNKDVRFYKRNLNEDLSDIFEEHKPDVVYHYAAYAAEGLSPFIRRYNYTNNLLASANLINNSIEHNVNRFIFASSMSVYGEKHSPPFDENMEQAPIDPYGVAKFSVEQDLAIAFAQHSLNYTIIRPHNFYGRNQNIWDKYRNVLGIWMYQIINDMQTIFGDGKQTRAFSYVDDSIAPFWNASQNDKCIDQIINLGGIESCSILDACEMLIEISGTNLTPKFLEQRHEVKHAFSTWEKSVDLLDFKHETDLKTGLKKMWDWAIKQPNRDRFVWEEYEVHKGIYSYWK